MTSIHEHVIMCHEDEIAVKVSCVGTIKASSSRQTSRLRRTLLLAVACFAVVASPCADARQRHRHTPTNAGAPARPHDRAASGVLGSGEPFAASENELYRSRGYGIGGVPFTLGGQGGLALSGACAQVANRNPACGPSGGYGLYGNGLGYGFGSP